MGELTKHLLQALIGFFKTWLLVIIRMPTNHGIFIEELRYKKRLEKCSECPEYWTEHDMCRVCYCVMAVKAKLIESQCPLNKW